MSWFSVDSSVQGLSWAIYCVVSSAYRRRKDVPAEYYKKFPTIFWSLIFHSSPLGLDDDDDDDDDDDELYSCVDVFSWR